MYNILLILQGVATVLLVVGYLIIRYKNQNYHQTFIRFEQEIELLSRHHSIKDVFSSNIIAMVDSNEFLAMQIKDNNDRYIFGNKTLRGMLFNDIKLSDMIGKNDMEILTHESYPDDKTTNYIDGLTPEQLINIDSVYFADRICNLTDVITKSFGEPCRFFEIVDDLALDVFKCPVYNSVGEIIATAGSLVDITEHKDKKLLEVQELVREGKAFPIGKSKNYYLLRDYCDVFTCF